MPRATKRKAVDAPIPAPASGVPPAKRARKSTGAAIEEDGDGDWGNAGTEDGSVGRMMAMEMARAKGSEKHGYAEEEEEDDDGDVMTDTQQLLAIVRFGSKEKRDAGREMAAYARALEKRMQKRREEVKSVIKKREDEGVKYDAEFLSSFKEAYTAASPFASHATLRQRSKALVSSARGLVDTFEHAAARVAALDTARLARGTDAWRDEDAALARLLAAGRRVAAHKHRGILHGSGKKAHKTRMTAEEARAEKILYDEEDGGEGVKSAWGEVARSSEKAARRLARATVRG